jgi:hypothetical protein
MFVRIATIHVDSNPVLSFSKPIYKLKETFILGNRVESGSKGQVPHEIPSLVGRNIVGITHARLWDLLGTHKSTASLAELSFGSLGNPGYNCLQYRTSLSREITHIIYKLERINNFGGILYGT